MTREADPTVTTQAHTFSRERKRPAAQTQFRLAAGWLLLGVGALAVAGLFAILLVLSRTPGTQELFPWVDFFRTALVVHVDHSVLIWFLAFGGVLWTLSGVRHSGVQWTGLGLGTTGALVVALAPFAGAGDPLMNNYVPVLQHPLFFLGLGLFALGVAVPLLATTLSLQRLAAAWREADAIHVGIITGAWCALAALLVLIWSYIQVPDTFAGQAYFEYLFWGGGHLLQFAYTQLMLAAWLWLARQTGLRLPLSERALSMLLVLGALPVLAAPLLHLLYGSTAAETRLGYTRLMQFGGGIAAIPIGLALLVALWRGPKVERSVLALRRALWTSLLLFGIGGLIGALIGGVNTVIPAHYHGSIVGVTLAFMGLSYHLLPSFGFPRIPWRLARVQPLVYAAGQLLHVTGLAVSGAMGIQRKTAGAAQGLDRLPEILAMGVMGIGGLLAVAGGVLFVVAVLTAVWRAIRD